MLGSLMEMLGQAKDALSPEYDSSRHIREDIRDWEKIYREKIKTVSESSAVWMPIKTKDAVGTCWERIINNMKE